MKKTKQQQIEEFLSAPIKVGDRVTVRGLGTQNKQQWGNTTAVKEVLENDVIIITNGDKTIQPEDYKKWYGDIGSNPFPEHNDSIRNVNFQLESILHYVGYGSAREVYYEQGLPIAQCNWNPFVYDKDGKKQYYQRPLVWTDEDKRLLIDSIYNNVDCGKVLIRQRSWETITKMVNNGETEIAFNDIVDGKQRLNAIKDFMDNKFADSYGNYYSDLSSMAQQRLLNHQLISFSEMPPSVTDEEVITQFLKLNFTGVPQSKEHIDYVKEISKKFA